MPHEPRASRAGRGALARQLPGEHRSGRRRDGLDPAFVRHLDRKYKRLRPKGGACLRVVTDPDEVDGLLEVLRDFRAARFRERRGIDLLQDPDCFAFYREVAHDGTAGKGPAVLAVLEVGGRPAAITLDLLQPDRELYLVVGYDFEKLRNYSLGLLIVDQLAQAAIARGQPYLDLTVGDEPYKADFGAVRRSLFQIRHARTVLGHVADASQVGYLRLRRLAQRVLLAWKARRSRRDRARRS